MISSVVASVNVMFLEHIRHLLLCIDSDSELLVDFILVSSEILSS